ncbi:MAG: hypothetical protein ABW221_01565 [Vicinamibacteria bacterium]
MTRSVLAVAVLATGACAPVFSDLQSARMLPKGAVEVTAHGTSTWFGDDDESEHVQNHFGVQLGTGVTERVEVRARYERILVGDDGSANLLAIGPKIGLVEDRLALSVPVALAFSGDEDAEGTTVHTQPGLIATFPVSDVVELNPSVKYTIPIDDEDGFRGLSLNLGLGLGPRSGKWVVRPEAGVLFGPDDVKYYQASVGLSIRPQ